MPNPQKLVLVDGSSMFFRAFFAIPKLATADGLQTNAIYGFATMFRKLFTGRKPDLGAVVFDAPGPNFRDEKYPAYKAQRPMMAPELAEQLPYIDRVVAAHNFPMLRVAGCEADDVIGTLARLGAAEGMEVVIVSGDKDFAQLIRDGVRMRDTIRDIVYDPELVFKKWGVQPGQMVDLLALMGDDIDNIPGVPGIGQKGAATLLLKYGSLAGIFEHLDELKGKQKATLEQHREVALLSQDLARIDCHIALPCTPSDLVIVPPDPSQLNALYRELEFYSLLGEERRGTASQNALDVRVADTPAAIAAAIEHASGGLTAVLPYYDLPVVQAANGPERMAGAALGEPVGIALARVEQEAQPRRVDYLVLRGPGAQIDPAARAALAAYCADLARQKVAHNGKELWILLARQGVALNGLIGDTMLASFLLEPTKLIPHRLDQLAREYLHETLTPIKQLTGSGQSEKFLAELAPAAVADHAAREADAIARLWPLVRKRLIEAEQLEQLEQRDMPLSPVLGQMELDGIRVDGPDLAKMGQEFTAQLASYEARIYELAGTQFNIGSTKQLSKVLFEDLGLPVIKRTKSGYSTDAEVLERLAPKHAIASVLLEHRKLAKLINTYTDVLQRMVNPATGRIHATFQQTVGATGRLITTDPDLQRTPIRSAEGKRIRQAFVAEPGHRLLSADWSQIELRVLAHVSEDALLVESFQSGADVHRRTASQLFGVAVEAVTPEQRNTGKTINFATIYGQGATALGQILGIPRKEAQSYIDGYFAAYSGVRAWLDRTIAEASEHGYVETIFGRRRFIAELGSNNIMDRQAGERIAANTPIQGSAADLCKLAMLRIAAQLAQRQMRARMLLQVHDELVFEVPDDEVDALRSLVRAEMESVHPLRVPLVVDIGVGASWAEAH